MKFSGYLFSLAFSLLVLSGPLRSQCAAEYIGEYGFRFCGYQDTITNYQFTSTIDMIDDSRIIIRNFHNVPQSIIQCEDTIFAEIDCATDSLFFESVSFSPPGLSYSGSGHKVNDTITVNYTQINPNGTFNLCLVYVRGLADGLRNVNKAIPQGVYPNPFNDKLLISPLISSVFKAEVLSLNGQVLSTFQSNEIHALSLNYLDSGMYFIRLYSEKGIHTQRVIKE